ncbi:MAG TPA: TadA family conjugal transfer-associated ATPase, partial [Angustibacter sp.]|nr:TadA family conjugal transfer-associated ATPase [Angustibacter sp.]
MRAPDPRLVERVRTELASSPGALTRGRVAEAVRATGGVLGDEAVLAATAIVQAELVGAGPLEGLLADPAVTDVMVNGASGVWVDRGRGVERVRVDVGPESAVRALAVRLAAVAGRRLDDASPFVDARLPGGVRLHVALPPLVEGGTHLCLRVPRRRAMTVAQLVECDTIPARWLDVVTAVVEQRLAFLVCGGTGVGKTTVLGALLAQVPRDERIVVVEDCAEVRIDHPHVVRLESRAPNVEGRGRVDLTELVRQALRMRPDRLVVGEVRGAEVRELLAALNTGHEGGCGTLHANDATEVPARIEALGALAGLGRA